MSKFLKVSFPQKCIGCELCVMQAQKQLNKVGLEGSAIRILKRKKENSEFLEYSIYLDPRVNTLDLNAIKSSCPTGVFEIIEEDENGLI